MTRHFKRLPFAALAPVYLRRRKRPIVWLPLRFALREMRSGLRGFYIFIACIALGSMAIAGIGSVAAGLTDGLARQGQAILGGDLSFVLVQREAKSDELAFLQNRGKVSSVATMRAMVRDAREQTALVEIKAIDSAYPLFGHVMLDEPALDSSLSGALKKRGDIFGAVADPALLERLNIKTGALLTIGNAKVEIRAVLNNEPDKLAGGIGFGPRLMISQDGLRATGLLQPGSLVRWHYRLRLPKRDDSNAAVKIIAHQARAQLPEAGWDIRTRSNASPQLQRNIERFTQFLTIVGLTALLIGGVGVGNAIKSHLDRRRQTIAVMKALGANGARIFAIYLTQVGLVTLIGGAIGIVIGAALPFAIAGLFDSLIALPIVPSVHGGELFVSLLYSMLTALVFAIWPLAHAHDVPVGTLFRETVIPRTRWPRLSYIIFTIAAVLTLAAIAILLARDQRVAIIYVGIAAVMFMLLWLTAAVLMSIAKHAPHARSTVLRLAVANIHRPNAMTPTIVLSLGLGVALLVTISEIDANLRRQFANELPARAPSFYFLDIPSDRVKNFDNFIREQSPTAAIEEVPMLRGRIIAAAGVPVERIKPKEDAAWVLQSDRGITYSDTVPQGSRLVAGKWWASDYDGPPLVSFEKKLAEGLGLKLGDAIIVNVLGRNITATIANMRTVDWQSLDINFVMVFSPNTFRGAPHTHLAKLTYTHGSTPAQEGMVVRTVADNFPMVTTLRIKEALEAIGTLFGHLIMAIRSASVITLLSVALVLSGAFFAGQRHRVYDATILKTLGATRAHLLSIYIVEYLLTSSTAALFGLLSGSLAAWMIVSELMNLHFTWLPIPALIPGLAAMLATVSLGLIGTFRILGQKPAGVLRAI